MTTSLGKKIPLKLPRVDQEITTPFAGDAFNRSKLADELERLVSRLKNNSGVIALDAPWGEGKSWFARNWEARLKTSRKVVYIDAFAHDYLEDPFVILSGSLSELLEKETSDIGERFLTSAGKVSRALLPSVGKLAVNVGGLIATGVPGTGVITDKIIEAAARQVASITEKQLEKQIADFKEEKASIKVFKDELTEFTTQQKEPVIIIIDELDRCKPTYAVKLLERIKHFFDVPDLVFVLCLNREQLERSIEGIYGEINAAIYLSKFIDLTLRMPKTNSLRSGTSDIAKYVAVVAKKFEYDTETMGGVHLQECVIIWASIFELSFRDIERIFTLLALAPGVSESTLLKVYLAAIKVTDPDGFYMIAQGKAEGHKRASDVLNPKGARLIAAGHTDIYQAIHMLHENGRSDFGAMGSDQTHQLLVLSPAFKGNKVEQVIARFCKELDFQLGV